MEHNDSEDQEAALAAEEAGHIGGDPGQIPGSIADPAQQAVEEGGGGESEGFEQAEAQLIDRAENPRGPSPMADAVPVEPEDAGATYGEADESLSSEVESDR